MSCNPPRLGIYINTSKPAQDDRHFEDDIFKGISLNEKPRILLQISSLLPRIKLPLPEPKYCAHV